MSEEMITLNNLLTIRNHLGIVPKNQLLEMYQDPDAFLSFIDSVGILLENDSGFLLFDSSFIDKIFSVFQIYRFESDASTKEMINDLIGLLNRIKNYPNSLANILKNNYLAYQEEKRHVIFKTTDALIASISYDALVFTALMNGDTEQIQDGDYYLMSLHYLMSVCSEFFQDDEIFDRSLKLMDNTCSECRHFSKRKKYVKEAKERVMKLKEE